MKKWIIGFQSTLKRKIPLVSTQLSYRDHLGSWKVRWGIRRNRYRIPPGLYGVGNPDKQDYVFVTANYKMSFDKLRKELKGIDAWILVLDTKGINVWCAAGKGTFGTEELIRQIIKVGLAQIITHRTLILPQLGASGVAAHIVQKDTGFKVIFGPVYSHDITAFINNNLKATKEMRKISFSFKERMVLIPIEFVSSLKLIPFFIIFFGLFHLIHGEGFFYTFRRDFSLFIITIISGTVFVEFLLPWIPFRALAMKGWILGMITVFIGTVFLGVSGMERVAHILILPPLSSFLALLFTGSTPYTSLSGVQKEVLIAVPLMIISVISGIVLKII
ncbi:acetyl-CoA synthase subunit gamma [bacterium]|nr:acetyl-CoA synthase subunit gamma [bacterium]